METVKKPTIKEVVKKAKETGIIVSNFDLPAIINYINEYEIMTSFDFLYNYKEFGKTVITQR